MFPSKETCTAFFLPFFNSKIGSFYRLFSAYGGKWPFCCAFYDIIRIFNKKLFCSQSLKKIVCILIFYVI